MSTNDEIVWAYNKISTLEDELKWSRRRTLLLVLVIIISSTTNLWMRLHWPVCAVTQGSTPWTEQKK